MTAIAREAFLAFTLQDRKPTSVAVVLSTGAALGLVVLASIVDGPWRVDVLRAVLLFIAFGELAGGLSQALLTRQLFARAGWPYHAAHHGNVQDFGFYDLAMTAILVLIAVAPDRYGPILVAVIALYALHGTAYVIRFRRALASGDADAGAHLRLGLPLLVAALGVLLFRP